MDIIECRKISDDCWECSVTCDFDAFPRGKADKGYIKFNEGHFKTKEDCLIKCYQVMESKVHKGIYFQFIVSEPKTYSEILSTIA